VEAPPALESGLAQVVKDLADRRIALSMATFLTAVFIILTWRTHSVWAYFIPPPLGALLASVTLVLQPYNPYKNFFATLEGRKLDDIKTDSNAQRLLFILRSKKARLISLRTGLLLATSLCLLMVLVMFLQSKPFTAKLDPLDLVFNTFGFWVASLGVHFHCLLLWAFREWCSTRVADT
jgi:hypothetical protein